MIRSFPDLGPCTDDSPWPEKKRGFRRFRHKTERNKGDEGTITRKKKRQIDDYQQVKEKNNRTEVGSLEKKERNYAKLPHMSKKNRKK